MYLLMGMGLGIILSPKPVRTFLLGLYLCYRDHGLLGTRLLPQELISSIHHYYTYCIPNIHFKSNSIPPVCRTLLPPQSIRKGATISSFPLS